jgi:hypothetical protein
MSFAILTMNAFGAGKPLFCSGPEKPIKEFVFS